MKKIIVSLMMATFSMGAAQAADLKVAVAANFTAPMKELATKYEQLSGDKLLLSFGATGALYAQIKNGAPFDILLAADAKTPKKLVNETFGVADTTFTYAIGKLIVWSADTQLIKDADSLKSDQIKKLAVADPKLAPYGAASMQVLQALGLKDLLADRMVVAGNIGKTFQFVKTRNAQAGFCALSQVYKNGKMTGGSGWIVPTDLYTPIRQDAVLLSASKDKEAAKRFLDYLRTSKDAADVRKAFGYGTPN